ncbi:MAG: PBP1A family penicillin-binding protein [Deltaproteobacteria bacterium]|nr:PBP1A family penicillin-binding protein [Deltaproteobacteria bacterium]
MRFIQAVFFLTLCGALSLAGLFVYYGRDLPDVSALSSAYRPYQTTRILARDGEVLAEIFEERRTVVPFEDVPERVLKAVLAAEDADFYRHEGLDYAGMVRALLVNLREGSFTQGGSTITQQVVKNLLLTPERTIERKVKEVLLARKLEQSLSKDEILFLWLNQVNFGDGRYGIQEAARYYFGKDVGELSLGQAALLAGIPKAPSHYSPRHDLEAARERRDWVLGEMVRKGLADDEQAASARQEGVRLAPERTEELGCAPEVVAIAQKVLRERVGAEAARRGGFTIETAIDAGLQRVARRSLQEGLRELDARHGYALGAATKTKRAARSRPALTRTAPRVGHTAVAEVTRVDDDQRLARVRVAGVEGLVRLDRESRYVPASKRASELLRPSDRVRVTMQNAAHGVEPARMRLAGGPEGAAVLLDARTREVLALVGGYEAMPLGFDRATSAARQPGSAFKPIIYSAALNTRRFTPATILYDTPEVFERWRPRNFESWEYRGPVRLREALAQSINIAAVKLLSEVGVESAVAYAHALGIESELTQTLSLALGASEVSPIELANAYGVFASGGMSQPELLVTKIRDSRGREIGLPPRRPAQRVIGQDEAYLLTSLLTSVVDHGTGRAARRLGRPVAGKTGTSNDARDAWFVGYTPDLVACVWVGFDDHSPLGPGESGAKSALPIWVELVAAAEASHPAASFAVPAGIVTARIDPASGLLAYEGLATAITEQFLDGTEPAETARPPDVIDPGSFLLEEL